MCNDKKSKIATPQQRGQTVVWYAETKSVIATQQNYRGVYGSDTPDAKTIKLWFNKLLTTGSVLKQSSGVRSFYFSLIWSSSFWSSNTSITFAGLCYLKFAQLCYYRHIVFPPMFQ
ncbi:hypothetical protein C0J52_14433 [Blattella germanica]|nr:hypothetical protein C0J52_14433 [Blattella germanica]